MIFRSMWKKNCGLEDNILVFNKNFDTKFDPYESRSQTISSSRLVRALVVLRITLSASCHMIPWWIIIFNKNSDTKLDPYESNKNLTTFTQICIIKYFFSHSKNERHNWFSYFFRCFFFFSSALTFSFALLYIGVFYLNIQTVSIHSSSFMFTQSFNNYPKLVNHYLKLLHIIINCFILFLTVPGQ